MHLLYPTRKVRPNMFHVPLDIPVTTNVTISTHNQSLIYEGERILCTGCGRIGHNLWNCEFLSTTTQGNHQATPTADTNSKGTTRYQTSQWRIVPFSKYRCHTNKATQANTLVKRFNDSSSKFLDLGPKSTMDSGKGSSKPKGTTYATGPNGQLSNLTKSGKEEDRKLGLSHLGLSPISSTGKAHANPNQRYSRLKRHLKAFDPLTKDPLFGNRAACQE